MSAGDWSSRRDSFIRADDESYTNERVPLEGVLTLAHGATVEQVSVLLQARVEHLAAIVRLGANVGNELTAPEVFEAIEPAVEDVRMLANALRLRAGAGVHEAAR